MASRKLWAGAPGAGIDPPWEIPVRDKDDHPEATINGTRYSWEPGREDGVPPEALAVWRAYREANS